MNTFEDVTGGASAPTQPGNLSSAKVGAGIPKRFRRLKPDELVQPGDYVADVHRGLKPWQGPGGFRVDAFVSRIYRDPKRANAVAIAGNSER